MLPSHLPRIQRDPTQFGRLDSRLQAIGQRLEGNDVGQQLAEDPLAADPRAEAAHPSRPGRRGLVG